MKILVTGADGRVGANFTKLLSEGGHDVKAVIEVDSPRRHKLDDLDVEVVECQLEDREGLMEAVKGCEVIFHLGADMRADNVGQFDINTTPTFSLLEGARLGCPNLHRFIFASSDVLIPHSGVILKPIPSEAERIPVGMYTVAKKIGELLCHSYHAQYQTPTVCFRFAYVVGAGELLNFPWFKVADYRARFDIAEPTPEEKEAIETFRKLDKGGEEQWMIPRTMDGLAYKKGTVDVRDLVNCGLLAMEKDEAVGEIFPLGGVPLRWDIAIPYLSEKTGKPYIDVRVPGGGMHYEFDISKNRELLGYEPKHDEKSMIDAALAIKRGEDIGYLPP